MPALMPDLHAHPFLTHARATRAAGMATSFSLSLAGAAAAREAREAVASRRRVWRCMVAVVRVGGLRRVGERIIVSIMLANAVRMEWVI